jgi:hypothetical protein
MERQQKEMKENEKKKKFRVLKRIKYNFIGFIMSD